MGSTAMTTVDEKKHETALANLVQRSLALAITDADSCRAGKELQVAWKAYLKNVGFEFDPGIAKAKELLEHLRNQKKKWYDPGEAELKSVVARLDAYAAEERRLAQAEQDRINKELADAHAVKVEAERLENERIATAARKVRVAEIRKQLASKEITKRQAEKLLREAGAVQEAALAAASAKADEDAAAPPKVEVKPNIPTVAGVKSQVYYSAELVSTEQLIRAFEHAIVERDHKRAMFLSQFIAIDEQALGKFARETKDSQKATEQVPGVKFTSRG